ncbi:unnamed protein product [Protopolystoma xenopodis]|uniref:Uncharacterized protein n=1 Tax=Protopolystoma xenopodis TaxID=117903 RepID=A0A448WNZ5_9PLAT|nr:unnamed protein product [Protopolystoma xenopodis]
MAPNIFRPWHSNSSESSLDKNANFNDVAELPSAPSEKNCSDNSVLHDFKSLDNHSSFIHSQATRWSAPALTSTASASTNEFSSCRPLHTPLGQCLPTFKENASEICGPEPSSDLESQLSSSRLSDVCLASNGFAGSLKSESSDVSNIYDLEHDTSKIKPYFQVPSTKSIFLNNCDAVNSSNSRSSKELKLADNCSKTDFHNPHKVLSFEPRSRPHTASSIDLFPEHSANVGSPYQAEVESDESSSTCGTLSIHDNERVNDTASSISSAYAFLAGLLAAASGRKAIKTNLESNFKEACSSENNRYAYPYHWLRPPNAFLNRLSPKTSNSRWRYSTSNGSREEGSFPSSSHCSNISFRSTCSDQNLAVSSRDNLAADWRHRNSRSFAIPRDCLAEEEEEEDETEAEHSLEINIEDVSGKLDDDPEGDDACASNGICDDDGDDDNDDDSLADLDDYLLYYRTGDLLFGPPSSVSLTAGDYSNCPPPQSPHVSLGDFDSLSFPGLRAVGLSGNAYAQYRSHFGEMLTNQDDPVSAHTASSFVSPWRQECSQLAEKVHSLKSRMNEVKLRRERRREEFRRHAECEDALLTKESHKRLPPIKSEETSAPAHISNVIERSNSDNSSSTTLATRISNNNVTVIPRSLDVERSNTDQRPFTSHLYSRMEGADLILKRFSLPGRLKPVSLEATSSVPVSDSNAWKQLSRGRIQRPLTPIVPPTARPSTPVYPGQKTL